MSEKEQASVAILRAQAELVEALSELEKMPSFDLGGVCFSAHTLGNYLMVTGATVELLLSRLADHPDPQIRAWLEGLGHVTELMRQTVTQLMTSSVPTDAKLRFLKWDVVPLVLRACDYYQRIADPKNILIACEPQIDVAPVWTDPVALAAVMDNLLSNAVKYSFPGKKIWVQIREEATSFVCSVRDQGPGLSKEDQTKLFQKGVKLSSVPTGGEPASGYGLAVAKELIERLHGDLWCESKLGAGACFSFRLPAYQAQK